MAESVLYTVCGTVCIEDDFPRFWLPYHVAEPVFSVGVASSSSTSTSSCFATSLLISGLRRR